MMRSPAALAAVLLLTACDPVGRQGEKLDASVLDYAPPPGSDLIMPQVGCGELEGCYTVFAHGDRVLYRIDLAKRLLDVVGPFKTPKVTINGKQVDDNVTDLAVAPDDVIWAISYTNLYTVDRSDGHVTLVGPVTSCGEQAVAMTFTPNGNLYVADFKGAYCQIDVNQRPPKVIPVGTLGSNLALSGDFVAVADGTVFGTAYNMKDGSGKGTQADNLLVKLDQSTGKVLQTLGSTGYPKLFGVAFAEGQVFGFTHDGTGEVVTIDPKTGKGTHYGTFVDPDTGDPISFAGAGVNSLVAPPIQ